jgi:pimeloyl-ACP methyl ester carboxylesterase
LNDTANIAYARTAPDEGQLHQPVLFINGELDGLCNIKHSRFSEPMVRACQNLSLTNLVGGHWLPLELKNDVVQAIQSWLDANEIHPAPPSREK